MPDDPSSAARDFHERTKHVPGDSTATRRVDAGLIPKQYKRYLDLPAIALPPPAKTGGTLFEALAGTDAAARTLTFGALSAILHYSAGIVRRTTARDGRELAFRAASCTGALYHVELYVVCGDIDGALPAGVYHYDVLGEALRSLRTGDHRRALADACCDGDVATAAASVVLTSTFWRNAWRYEERAYRHTFWDGGTLLANLLAVAEGNGLQPSLHSAFVDPEVNALLGVDATREAAIAGVALGAGVPAAAASAVEALDHRTEPLSRAEIEYPLIWQTHAATSLADRDSVESWREKAGDGATTPRINAPGAALPTLESTIERRRSSRRFSGATMSLDALKGLAGAAQGSLRNDHARASALVHTVFIANRVDGLPGGIYKAGGDGGLSLVKAGDFSNDAAHIALDQQAAGQAAVNLYFVANWRDAAALGDRGYRALQIESGIRTGQAYLAAAALGLRATGLTFYDDEAATILRFDPAETAVLMLIVAGNATA